MKHVTTFERLVADIRSVLTPEDRARIIAFTALVAEADVFGIPGLSELPAIRWKRANLEKLRKTNRRKFDEILSALERALL